MGLCLCRASKLLHLVEHVVVAATLQPGLNIILQPGDSLPLGLLGHVWHDRVRVVIPGESTPNSRSRVRQGLAALVLDGALEVTSVSLESEAEDLLKALLRGETSNLNILKDLIENNSAKQQRH